MTKWFSLEAQMLRALKGLCLRSLDPTFVIGVLLTALFYYAVFQPGMHGSILHRYTTEHVVEYVIVGMFMWGIGDVLWKLLGFPLEIFALRGAWLSPAAEPEPPSSASALIEQVHERNRWLRESKVGQRLVRALEYASHSTSAKELDEHLIQLKHLEEDSTYAKYTLIRFVASVTPILGFLGTVVHFGTALSGISFSEMNEKLPVVVSEMGMAFNTTTVALVAATTMAFALFVCERIDRGIDESVTRLVHSELSNRFQHRGLQVEPFLSVVQSANEEALGSINSTLHQQIEVWSTALDKLFARFDARQQQELRGWQSAIEQMQQRFEDQESRQNERFRQSLLLVESWQDKHMAQIQTLLERAVNWKTEFGDFARSLDGIAKGESQLVELQSTLNENLHLLRATRQMDDALHGLTAAIHLLTARHPQLARQESAAA
jgi:biopolymer transport protein ExbB/TolQ